MDYTLPIGAEISAGKYVIDRVIGVGGFGITYAAHHGVLGTKYAIKELFVSGRSIREDNHYTVFLQNLEEERYQKIRKRFFDEAKTLTKLNNPHVVKVIDVFEENNTSYIVMDYVEGETLLSKIQRNGPIAFQEAVNYIAQLSEAVEYIHKKHILHRDIKPDNVMITPDEQVVLIDFGSARSFVNDEVQNHTTILTQGYAPIEQYSSTTKKGNYTDIYALGAVFYFILTGEKPIEATSRVYEDFKSPRDINPAVPEDVNRTIMKAMEIKPEDRYQDVESFKKDLLGETIAPEPKPKKKTELPKEEPKEEPKTEAKPKTPKKNEGTKTVAVDAENKPQKSNTAEVTEKKPKKRKTWKIWVPILCSLLLLLAGGGFAWWYSATYLYWDLDWWESEMPKEWTKRGDTIFCPYVETEVDLAISTNGRWRVKNAETYYMEVEREGNLFGLFLDENDSENSRSTYFDIQSGFTKKRRVYVCQSGRKGTFIDVLPDKLTFEHTGGTQPVRVITDGEWRISANTDPWGRLRLDDADENKLHVTVNPNDGSSNRNDYFVVATGSLSHRVNIVQKGKYLRTDKNNLRFTPDGTAQTIQVESSGTWEISVGTVSWAHLSRSGNTLTLYCDANTGTSARNDYFVLKCPSANLTYRVDFTQAGKYLRTNKNNLTFGCGGNASQTIQVECSDSWYISTNTASWAHLSRNGNTLTLYCDANNSTNTRNDYFILTSGNLTKRVNFSQTGKYLRTNKNNLTFGSSGYSSQTIQVECSGTWYISTNTASWAHLSRNGNTLTLYCERNSGRTRNDYFILTSGNMTHRVNFTQY